MEGKNGNTVLLTVIGVATLLVALVGATFAYFSATVSNSANQSVTVTTAAPVSLVYESDGAIAVSNALPGADGTSTFTVNNPSTSSVAQTYDLTLIVDVNQFTTAKGANDVEEGTRDTQLLITVSATSENTTDATAVNTVAVPALQKTNVTLDGKDAAEEVSYTYNVTDGTTAAAAGKEFTVVNDQKIEIGETQTYTIDVDFLNLSISQNANQKVTFSGHIDISDPRSV